MAPNPNRKHKTGGKPKLEAKLPNIIDTKPVVKAYGIWVFTWFMWLQFVAIELSIVVSEIGEQWSPKTEPHKTLAAVFENNAINAVYSYPASNPNFQLAGNNN